MEQIDSKESFYGEKEVTEKSIELAVFSLSTETYALDLYDILEILVVPNFTLVPGAPPHVVGLINYRGSILPVIDLKKIFGLPESKSDKTNRIIALKSKEISVGLLVDCVGRSVNIPVSKIEPPINTLKGNAASFIKGETQVNGKLLAILKVDKLMQSQN